MPITEFPDPRDTEEDGLLAIGGDLHPESLALAYSQGIFPWPVQVPRGETVLAWFCPPERAVLDFADLHIPKSLEKTRRTATTSHTIDQAFDQVIEACAATRRDSGTWITRELITAYRELHRLGFAHSVETWEGSELVGGIYGVSIAGYFAGESMFYRKPNGSKLALLHLISHLKSKGFDWMDIQMLTPHMEALGAKTIPRDEFLERLALLKRARARSLPTF